MNTNSVMKEVLEKAMFPGDQPTMHNYEKGTLLSFVTPFPNLAPLGSAIELCSR